MKESFLTRIFGRKHMEFESHDAQDGLGQSSDCNVVADKELIVDVAPSPYEALLTAAVLCITLAQNEAKDFSPACRDAYYELERLENLNLGNSATAQEYRILAERYSSYLDAKTMIDNISKIWSLLGKDTLVLKREHFIDILNQNNLVCGWIEDYVGAIPRSAIESYERVSKKARRSSYRYSPYNSFVADYFYDDKGLPWIPYRRISPLDCKNNPFFIAAPARCFRTTPMRTMVDPFIFSIPNWSDVVLIHAKWGSEAEDATIKRYEQLRDAVIGKGGAV